MENPVIPPFSEKILDCKHCGARISWDEEFCPYCDRRVDRPKPAEPTRVALYNTVQQTPTPQYTPQHTHPAAAGKARRKWVAFALCLFVGVYGAHKFYEGKIGTGLLYLFTAGLFGFGWIADCILLLFKPDPYYV